MFCECVFYTVILDPKLGRLDVPPILQINVLALLLFIVQYLEETNCSGF